MSYKDHVQVEDDDVRGDDALTRLLVLILGSLRISVVSAAGEHKFAVELDQGTWADSVRDVLGEHEHPTNPASDPLNMMAQVDALQDLFSRIKSNSIKSLEYFLGVDSMARSCFSEGHASGVREVMDFIHTEAGDAFMGGDDRRAKMLRDLYDRIVNEDFAGGDTPDPDEVIDVQLTPKGRRATEGKVVFRCIKCGKRFTKLEDLRTIEHAWVTPGECQPCGMCTCGGFVYPKKLPGEPDNAAE